MSRFQPIFADFSAFIGNKKRRRSIPAAPLSKFLFNKGHRPVIIQKCSCTKSGVVGALHLDLV